METTTGTSFSVVLLTCLYLSLISCPGVSGKCWGKWAIHACWGGNGKRSEPSYAANELPAYRRADPNTPLRNLLLTDSDRLNRLLRISEDPHLSAATDRNDATEFTDQVAELTDREEQLRKFKNYILGQKLKRALRVNVNDRLI